MQRHAAFAIPLRPRDLDSVETPGAHDLDALGAQPHRVLHRALHRAAEHDALLELLRDGVRNQLRIDFRFPNLLDVEADVATHHLSQIGPQRLDVLALLADDHARTRAVDGDARVLRGALDRDLAHRRVPELLLQVLADLDVFLQCRPEVLAVREPLGRPVPRHREAESCRMYFLSHDAPYLPSPTVTWMWHVCFRMTLPRPFARAVKRRRLSALSTRMVFTLSSSTSAPSLCSALAIADSSTFLMMTAPFFGLKARMLSAWSTGRPRIWSATSRPFCADSRTPRRIALVSIGLSLLPRRGRRRRRDLLVGRVALEGARQRELA